MKKNSGFSLVELIVVIAIMAILVGVLAPAYLKYVEKSRKSKDIDAISEMMSAADKIAVDDDNVANGDTFKITETATGTVLTLSYTGSSTDAQAAWQKSAGLTSATYDISSKTFKKQAAVLTGTVDSEGSVTWSGTGAFAKGATGATAYTKFSKDLNDKLC